MATAEVRQETPRHPAKDPGLPAKLLWHWPWAIIGVLLASWVCSLLIEWVGIAFFWADEGAEHSRQVMLTESGYLSEGFTRSLLMSSPAQWLAHTVEQAYRWLFVESGLMESWQNVYPVSGNAVARELDDWRIWFVSELRDYLLATVYVTLTFLSG